MTGIMYLLAEAATAAEETIDLNSEIANFGPIEFLFSGFGIILLSALFVVPLFLAKKSQLRIDKFRWFESIRPKDPYDVLVVSDEMRQIFGETVNKRRTVVRNPNK